MVLSRGRDSHVKGAGILVVSLRSVNFGFWSHLKGVQGKTALYLAVKVRLGLHAKSHCIFIVVWFKMVPFKGQKLGPRPDFI